MTITLERIRLQKQEPYRIRAEKIERTPIHWHEGVTEILLLKYLDGCILKSEDALFL